MTSDNVDFLERLVKDVLNKQGYYTKVVSPLLVPGNSIAVMPMPTNEYDHYFDGSYRQGYAFQIVTRHTEQLTAYHTLSTITNFLRDIRDVPSDNGSYAFEGIKVQTEPHSLGKNETHYMFVVQFTASLYIENK